MIAVAILDNLGNHKLSFPNVKRYITPLILSRYRIRLETNVTDTDLRNGLDIAVKACQCKPPIFRYALLGSPKAQRRREFILSAKLVELDTPWFEKIQLR